MVHSPLLLFLRNSCLPSSLLLLRRIEEQRSCISAVHGHLIYNPPKLCVTDTGYHIVTSLVTCPRCKFVTLSLCHFVKWSRGPTNPLPLSPLTLHRSLRPQPPLPSPPVEQRLRSRRRAHYAGLTLHSATPGQHSIIIPGPGYRHPPFHHSSGSTSTAMYCYRCQWLWK